MNALDNLYKKNNANSKKENLENRKKKLSDLLLSEKKVLEVCCKLIIVLPFKIGCKMSRT